MSKYINADDFFRTFAELVISPYIDFPAADVRENKHGEWIPMGDVDQDNNQLFMCSNCCSGDLHAVTVEVPFCWKCGAKMRGCKE